MCLALPDSFVVVLSVTSILRAFPTNSQRMTIGNYSSVSALREPCLKSGGMVSYVARFEASISTACENFHIGNKAWFPTDLLCDYFHKGSL